MKATLKKKGRIKETHGQKSLEPPSLSKVQNFKWKCIIVISKRASWKRLALKYLRLQVYAMVTFFVKICIFRKIILFFYFLFDSVTLWYVLVSWFLSYDLLKNGASKTEYQSPRVGRVSFKVVVSNISWVYHQKLTGWIWLWKILLRMNNTLAFHFFGFNISALTLNFMVSNIYLF